jgi:hypothetical protein
MTSAIAKELPPYRLATVNSRHAGGERFRVHVLGRFRLLGGDTPITIPPRLRKPQEPLQAVIAFGGTEVSADVLIDALWPDSEGDAAYHALESALYRLRQLLGARDAVRNRIVTLPFLEIRSRNFPSIQAQCAGKAFRGGQVKPPN